MKMTGKMQRVVMIFHQQCRVLHWTGIATSVLLPRSTKPWKKESYILKQRNPLNATEERKDLIYCSTKKGWNTLEELFFLKQKIMLLLK